MPISHVRAILAGLLLSGTVAGAQPDPEFSRDFDRADRRASGLVFQLRCAQEMAGIRARGGFGAADTLGFTGQCVRVGDGYVGVYLNLDSTATRHTRFSAVTLGKNVPFAAVLDTANLVAGARARRDALTRGASDMGRPFAPFIHRGSADTLEVWLIPISVLSGSPPSSGGERGYIYAPDGKTVVRTVDARAAFDTLPPAASGTLTIGRRNERLPLLTDLLVANLQLLRGGTVSIELAGVTSTLMNTAGGGTWLQVARTSP